MIAGTSFEIILTNSDTIILSHALTGFLLNNENFTIYNKSQVFDLKKSCFSDAIIESCNPIVTQSITPIDSKLLTPLKIDFGYVYKSKYAVCQLPGASTIPLKENRISNSMVYNKYFDEAATMYRKNTIALNLGITGTGFLRVKLLNGGDLYNAIYSSDSVIKKILSVLVLNGGESSPKNSGYNDYVNNFLSNKLNSFEAVLLERSFYAYTIDTILKTVSPKEESSSFLLAMDTLSRQYILSDPTSIKGYRMMARVKLYQQQFDSAIFYNKMAYEINLLQNASDKYFNDEFYTYAMAYKLSGKKKKAKCWFEKIAINSTNSRYTNLGYIFIQEKILSSKEWELIKRYELKTL
ncbi:MAG: hypothetical protein QM727_04400 [Niabella sp.]